MNLNRLVSVAEVINVVFESDPFSILYMRMRADANVDPEA